MTQIANERLCRGLSRARLTPSWTTSQVAFLLARKEKSIVMACYAFLHQHNSLYSTSQ